MKRNVCRKAAVCFWAAGMALFSAFISYGGSGEGWQAWGSQWKYRTKGGKDVLRSSWHQEDGSWYRFDEEGYMKTGWYQDGDGQWYFLNSVSDGTKGRMMTGWQWIDGYCYYLSEQADASHPEGAMYAGQQTPDGYQVDKSGAWADDAGLPVYRPGAGIAVRAEHEGSGKEKSETAGTRQETEGERRRADGKKDVHSAGSGGRPSMAGNGSGSHGSVRPGTAKPGTGHGENGAEGSSYKDTSRQDYDDQNQDHGEVCDGPQGNDKTGERVPEAQNNADAGHDAEGAAENENSSTSQETSVQEHEGREEAVEPLQADQSNPTDSWQEEQTNQTDAWEQEESSQAGAWEQEESSQIGAWEQEESSQIDTWEQEESSQADAWQQERQALERYMEIARKQESEFLGVSPDQIPDSRFLVEDKNSCRLRLKSAAGRIGEGETGIFYVIGKNYVPEASVLAEQYGDAIEYSNTIENQITLEKDTYTLARFHLYRKSSSTAETPVWTGNEKRHWNVGDVQERELDGITYRFRCIDQNYGDETDRSRQKALFLCDTVIPADTGSYWTYEKTEEGTWGYRFYPGPLVSFGESDSYKHSRVRSWLKEAEENFGELSQVAAGVVYAYEGSTKEGSRQQMVPQGLKPRYLGNQSMTDGLFLLSVDEALKYRSWLWRFEGAKDENPESQQSSFCKSYWLRTPFGGRNAKEGEMVYVVDLIRGNIHPQPIKTDGTGEDEELNITGTTGVRPAFTVPQN